MYKIESKSWSSCIRELLSYCPDDCVLTLPDDAVHITKYTTRYNEHNIDIWFSPSNETVYLQQIGRYKIVKIREPDGNHSHRDKYFYTWSYTTHHNVLIRVNKLLSPPSK